MNRRITRLSQRISSVEEKVREVKRDLKVINPRPTLHQGKKEITLKKAVISPNFKSKTVLTDSTWRYVEIFLKEQGADEALFYWAQAQSFCKATESLPLVSAPLTSYYTLLNAVKALLSYKEVGFDNKHGVSGRRVDGRYNLQNERVSLKPKGIASSLSTYFKEPIPSGGVEYDLKSVLRNLQFIHRAYTLTHGGAELFIPIIEPRFVHDKSRCAAWFEAELEPQHSTTEVINRLIGFGVDRLYEDTDSFVIRRNKTFNWSAPRNVPTAKSLTALHEYHVKIRKQLRYIYSSENLWYIKRKDLRRGLIDRNTLVLIFIAMHRLSELSRYQPNVLQQHLEKKSSWLLSEFITKSLVQFIDQISSEITGDDFRITGFRA